jgi:hypothetical protein
MESNYCNYVGRYHQFKRSRTRFRPVTSWISGKLRTSSPLASNSTVTVARRPEYTSTRPPAMGRGVVAGGLPVRSSVGGPKMASTSAPNIPGVSRVRVVKLTSGRAWGGHRKTTTPAKVARLARAVRITRVCRRHRMASHEDAPSLLQHHARNLRRHRFHGQFRKILVLERRPNCVLIPGGFVYQLESNLAIRHVGLDRFLLYPR